MLKEALIVYGQCPSRTWKGSRGQTVGASEIGACARQVYFKKNEGDLIYGRNRDEDYSDRWGATARGILYESCFWYPALKKAFGDRLVMSGDQQRTFATEFLSATPDGLILGDFEDGDSVVIEAKTVDPRSTIKHAKANHVYQVQVQMGLVRERTPYRPGHALITYTDCSFFDEIAEFSVAFDPAVYEEAKVRAANIMLARSADELPPEGVIAGGKECATCPFTAACGAVRAARVPNGTVAEYDPVELALLEQAVAEAKVYAEAAADYAQRERDAKESVKEILQRIGTKKVKTPDFSVVWSALRGRPSWDAPGIRAAAEAAGVNLAPFMTEGEPSDRIQITVKGASSE